MHFKGNILKSRVWKNEVLQSFEMQIKNICFEGKHELLPCDVHPLELPRVIPFGSDSRSHEKALNVTLGAQKFAVTRDGTLYISRQACMKKGIECKWEESVTCVDWIDKGVYLIYTEDRLMINGVLFRSVARDKRYATPIFCIDHAHVAPSCGNRLKIDFSLSASNAKGTIREYLALESDLERPETFNFWDEKERGLVEIVAPIMIREAKEKIEKVYVPFLRQIAIVIMQHIEASDGATYESIEAEAEKVSSVKDLQKISKKLPALFQRRLREFVNQAFNDANTNPIVEGLKKFTTEVDEDTVAALGLDSLLSKKDPQPKSIKGHRVIIKTAVGA